MTPEKLEALRVMAAREDTPIEEARNAALAFVRGGGSAAKPQAITIEDVKRLADVDMVRRAFGPELDALKAEETKRRAALQEQIGAHLKANDELRARLKASEDQLADIRRSLKKIVAFATEEPPKETIKATPFAPRSFRVEPGGGFYDPR